MPAPVLGRQSGSLVSHGPPMVVVVLPAVVEVVDP